MNYLLASIPFIVSVGVLIAYQNRNGNRFGPVSFLISAYVFVYGCSLVVEFLGLARRVNELDVFGVGYLALATVIILFAHFRYHDPDVLVVKVESVSIKRLFDFVFLISNFAAIIFFFPSVIHGLTGDVGSNRVSLGDTTQRLQDAGLINTYFSTICSSFGISLVLGFSNLTMSNSQRPNNRWIGWALLLSSTSYIIYIFAWVGRDGVVFWLLLFALVHLLFYPGLSPGTAKNIKRLYISVFLVSLPAFMLITIARFGGGNESVFVWILIYIGEQVSNFNDYFAVYGEGYSQGGALNFPLLAGVVSEVQHDRAAMYDLYLGQGVQPWKFATFVGSFFMDVGPYFTLLLLSVYFYIVRLNKLAHPVTLSALCVFVTIIQIPLFGVFYFRQYSSNFAVIFSLLVALMLHLATGRKGKRC